MEEIFRTVLKEASKSSSTKSTNNATTSKAVSLSEEQRLNREFIANIINKESIKLAAAATKNSSLSLKKSNNKNNYNDCVTSSSNKTAIKHVKNNSNDLVIIPNKNNNEFEFLSSNSEFKTQKINSNLCNENNENNNLALTNNSNKDEINVLYNGIVNSNTASLQLSRCSDLLPSSLVSLIFILIIFDLVKLLIIENI